MRNAPNLEQPPDRLTGNNLTHIGRRKWQIQVNSRFTAEVFGVLKPNLECRLRKGVSLRLPSHMKGISFPVIAVWLS